MPADINTLCLSFLMFLNQQNLYEPVKTCPQVNMVSINELQTIACDGAECPVKAFYDLEDKTIFLSSQLDLDFSLDRSILLHELVHYVQDINGKWEEGEDECRAGMQRELYAFRVQEKYLLSQNVRIPVSQQMAYYRC